MLCYTILCYYIPHTYIILKSNALTHLFLYTKYKNDRQNDTCTHIHILTSLYSIVEFKHQLK